MLYLAASGFPGLIGLTLGAFEVPQPDDLPIELHVFGIRSPFRRACWPKATVGFTRP